MRNYKIEDDSVKGKIKMSNKEGIKKENYETPLWATSYENGVLTQKRCEVVCEGWRERFYPFLQGYLK